MIIPTCTEFKYLPISFVSAMHALMVILQRPFHAHTHHAPIHTYFLSPVSTTCDIYLIVFVSMLPVHARTTIHPFDSPFSSYP